MTIKKILNHCVISRIAPIDCQSFYIFFIKLLMSVYNFIDLYVDIHRMSSCYWNGFFHLGWLQRIKMNITALLKLGKMTSLSDQLKSWTWISPKFSQAPYCSWLPCRAQRELCGLECDWVNLELCCCLRWKRELTSLKWHAQLPLHSVLIGTKKTVDSIAEITSIKRGQSTRKSLCLLSETSTYALCFSHPSSKIHWRHCDPFRRFLLKP